MEKYKRYILNLAFILNQELKNKKCTQDNIRTTCDCLQRLLMEQDIRLRYLIDKKKNKITIDERNKVSVILSLGYLNEINKDLREILIVILFEIQYYQNLLALQDSLEKYENTQQLFQTYPHLLEECYNFEMIQSNAIEIQANTNIAKIDRHFVYVNHYIPTHILNQLKEQKTSYFIKVTPHEIYKEIPPQYIAEEKWREPNPKWKNAISIKNNYSDGFSYYIPDDIVATDKLKFIDRKVKGVIRLEGKYQRDRNGYFSMIVEELMKINHPFKINEFYLIGRMIHLDSNEDDSKGMNSKLEHIDIAINLYTDEDAYTRYNNRLEDGGSITKATNRSHLLRINNTVLSTISLLSSFFVSQYLTQEWIVGMFEMDND